MAGRQDINGACGRGQRQCVLFRHQLPTRYMTLWEFLIDIFNKLQYAVRLSAMFHPQLSDCLSLNSKTTAVPCSPKIQLAMSLKKRSPSPTPTVSLDQIPKPDLQRSSSEESLRVLHHAVLFPTSPHPGRVIYFRRTLESDADLIRRQQAAIALQPLTYAEELAAKRKQLEIRTEKRKLEKAAAAEAKEKAKVIPEITIVPASGKVTPTSSTPLSPTKLKMRTTLKDKGKLMAKQTPMSTTNRHNQKSKQSTSDLGQITGKDKLNASGAAEDAKKTSAKA